MMRWKERKLLRAVHGAEEYIEIVYIKPYEGPRFSVSEDDEDDLHEPEEEASQTTGTGKKPEPGRDVRYQRRDYSKPSAGVQYSERDYGIQYSERDYGDWQDDSPDDGLYHTFRSVLRNNPDASLEMLNRYVSPSFVDTLLRFIDQKNMKDSQVYKAAGIDRRLFSKIVSDRSYKPARDTCIALCIGLRLNLKDASELLKRAGYTLSHSNKRDIAIEFFLVEGIYKLQEINEVLDRLGMKLLGRE